MKLHKSRLLLLGFILWVKDHYASVRGCVWRCVCMRVAVRCVAVLCVCMRVCACVWLCCVCLWEGWEWITQPLPAAYLSRFHRDARCQLSRRVRLHPPKVPHGPIEELLVAGVAQLDEDAHVPVRGLGHIPVAWTTS